MTRLTVAALAEQVAQQNAQTQETLGGIVTVLGTLTEALQAGQHNTTTEVAEATSKGAKKAKAETKPVVVNPRDVAKAGVEAKGLAFAKGGALQGSVAVAEAIVRVLKANKVGGFEVVSVQGDIKSMDQRKVTHVAVFLVAPGHFATQYVYTPEA